jgi:hypothetical protein
MLGNGNGGGGGRGPGGLLDGRGPYNLFFRWVLSSLLGLDAWRGEADQKFDALNARIEALEADRRRSVGPSEDHDK